MRTDDGVEMPRRATRKSAGYDFYAPHDIVLEPGKWVEFDTGVRFDGTELPCEAEVKEDLYSTHTMTKNWFMMLVPRSGLGFKYGVRMSNTIGIVDQDYRQNIRCKLTCDEPVTIKKGERYMQGIFVPFGILFEETIPLKERDGGFGSTGA